MDPTREKESRATKRDLAKDYRERAEKQGFDPRNSSQAADSAKWNSLAITSSTRRHREN
jgi:hypothetical protein